MAAMNGGIKKMISIIIPTRNKASRLRLTLAGLASQKDESDKEIIVINDGSDDDTLEVIQKASEFMPLRMVSGVKRGRAASRNHGAALAEGDLLIFIDDDILTIPEFISEHKKIQAERPGLVHGCLRDLVGVTRVDDPCKGGPGAPRFDIDQIIQNGFHPDGYRLVANALERAVELMYDGQLPNVSPWLAGAGANISLPRNTWEQANGFDEGFGSVWGCEDLEFALRLHQRKTDLSFAPKAFGIHLCHERNERWEKHEVNFKRFASLYPIPGVALLPLLLRSNGNPKTYVSAVMDELGQKCHKRI
jgi:glycosyltransferase involved in cell wall biosynthesis